MAVIKQSDRPQFFNQRIGINRFDSNSEAPWEALSRAAGDIASLTINRMAEDAIEKGTEQAESASLLITDEDGFPKFLTAPSNLSRTAQKAYKRVIDQRYAVKLNSELQLKNKELKQKHPYDSKAYSKEFSIFAKTLADTSGPKWGAKINDMSIHMLAMNKLDIESATSNKIFLENKVALENYSASLVNQIAEASKLGEALSDPDTIKEGSVPLSVSYYNELRAYLKEGIDSTLINREEANKYLTQAKTNMALGSIDILLNRTTSKIQRDIVQGFVLSGDTSGLNLLPNGMANNLIELKKYINTFEGGNLGTISTRITQARGPLDKKDAFVLEENEKIRKIALQKATQRNEVRTKIAKANRELVLEQTKVFAKSLEISSAAQKKQLEKLEKNRKTAVKEAATKFYLRGGLTAGVFNEVLILKQTLNNIGTQEANVYYETLTNGISDIFNNHINEIDKFASEEINALTKDERKEAYKKVKSNLATSVINLFGNEIKFSPAELNKFGDVLLDVELPNSEGQFYAKQIIKEIFNNDPDEIKKFIKDFKPSSRQVMLEKEKTIFAWNNLVEFATNANPNIPEQSVELEKRLKEFNSQPTSSYITANQRQEAEDSIKLFQTKKIAAEKVSQLSSNDVNNLELLNIGSIPKNFNLNDAKNKSLLETSNVIKSSGVDVNKINTFLSTIKSDKLTNETKELETKKETELRSALTSGVKDLRHSDADHRKLVDEYIADVGLENFIKGINENPELNNLINKFGSDIIMDFYKDIVSGNTVGITDELISNGMTSYATNSKIRRDEKTPLINNYVAQGYLTQTQADKLDLMLLLKQQAGMETRSFANISSLIDSSTAEQDLTIEYSGDGSQQDRLKKATSRQLLLMSMGTSAKSLRAKPATFSRVVNPSQAEKNFIQKYDRVAKAYMAAGLSADAIIGHFSKKFNDEYEMKSEFVFEDNGINNLDHIRKNQKFKTQYPIGKYLQTEDETNWWTEKVETNLNTQGFTLYESNKQYDRVVLKPYIKTDSPVQVYNPYILTDNNVLEPALYNLITGDIADPKDLFETKSEISIPHFPTNFKELYDYREKIKQNIRDKMSDEIRDGVGENQKMGIGLQLYRGFVFGTTAPIPGMR